MPKELKPLRVIAKDKLLLWLFSELQSIAIERGSCHYGDYEQWCIFGRDIEKAIERIFADSGTFRPTIDIEERKNDNAE